MKAVVIGPGRIGCGLAGQLLHSSGYQLVFVGRSQAVVDQLNKVGRYIVRLVDEDETNEVVVDGVRAISNAETERVAAEIAGADLIVTSVGSGNLGNVAQLIAGGLIRRTTPVNILAFENLLDAGTHLKKLVTEQLPHGSSIAEHGFSGVVARRIVPHRLLDPLGRDPLVFVGDTSGTFVVDAANLREPLPMINGMLTKSDYYGYMLRKIFTFSVGHVAAACLGYLKAHRYIHEAIRDQDIEQVVMAAMREGQCGLETERGAEVAGDERDLMHYVKRFKNSALKDPIARVGRDPGRKADMLLSAARLAEQAGVRPRNLGLALAAARYYSTQV